MYQQWNCKKHGNHQYQEKYLPRCKQCFLAMKEDLKQTQESLHNANKEIMQQHWWIEVLKKKLGQKLVDKIIDQNDYWLHLRKLRLPKIKLEGE